MKGGTAAPLEHLGLPATDESAFGSKFGITGSVQAAWAALVGNAVEPAAQLRVNFDDHVSGLGSVTLPAWYLFSSFLIQKGECFFC